MSSKTTSTMSNKRIGITIAIFCAIPVCAHLINNLVEQYDISLMFALNVGAMILIMYDWNLFGIHYNRAKYNIPDTILYSIIAFVMISLWTYISIHFLRCIVIIPNEIALSRYGYARIGMLLAYSFSEASALCILEKCATDHLQVRHHELQAILLSGIMVGCLMTILFLPSLNILTILTTLLYNVILCTILAYLYNQSHTFIPGLVGFAFSNLLFMLMMIL